MTVRTLLPTVTLVALVGCVSVPPNSGFDDLSLRVANTHSTSPVWPGVTITEQDAQQRVSTLLAEPLTEATVIELALLNNRGLRAEYLGLKAAAGDYKDDASLPNPFVSALVLDVEDEPVTNLSYGIGIELLDVLFFSRRMKAAGKTFEAEQAETTATVLDFIADIRVAYYDVVAANQIADLMAQADEASQASVSVAQALFDAGNIAQVELDREKLLAAEIALEAMQAEANLAATRERLNAKLGLDSDSAENWSVRGRLRNPPREEVFASFDVTENLYLAARDARIDAAGARLGLETASSIIGDLELELERERDDGEWENGVGIALELPIFNWGGGVRQAAGARLEAMLEQRVADSLELRAEARRLSGQLDAARDAAIFQRTELLPLAGRVMQGAQLDYNAMQIGVFALLDAKREQLAAGRNYVSALRDYWALKARYDQMIAGGSIGDVDMSDAASSAASGDRGDH